MIAASKVVSDSDAQIVLVVAHARVNQSSLLDLLSPVYKVFVAASAGEALAYGSTGPLPDLMLVDDGLPDASSLELCRKWTRLACTGHIPVLLLCEDHALDTLIEQELGLEVSLHKPVNPALILARIADRIRPHPLVASMQGDSARLWQASERQLRDNRMLEEVTTLALASLVEIRDAEIERHARRTQNYVMALINRLAYRRRFADYLDPATCQLLSYAAALHDIGKVGIPDCILLKPGSLTAEEFAVMKTHTTLGRAAIERAERQLGISIPLFCVIKDLAYSHHERWDGRGYPEGKIGDEISPAARIMAVADVYDAMVSRRAYKSPISHDQVVRHIFSKRSIDFDPDVVDAFIELRGQFLAIGTRFADNLSLDD